MIDIAQTQTRVPYIHSKGYHGPPVSLSSPTAIGRDGLDWEVTREGEDKGLDRGVVPGTHLGPQEEETRVTPVTRRGRLPNYLLPENFVSILQKFGPPDPSNFTWNSSKRTVANFSRGTYILSCDSGVFRSRGIPITDSSDISPYTLLFRSSGN